MRYLYRDDGERMRVVTDTPLEMDEYISISNKKGLIELDNGKTMRYLSVSADQVVDVDMVIMDVHNNTFGVVWSGVGLYDYIGYVIKDFTVREYDL